MPPSERNKPAPQKLEDRVRELELAHARDEGKESGERHVILTHEQKAAVETIARSIVAAEFARVAEEQKKVDGNQTTEIAELKRRMGLIQIGISTLITGAGVLGPKLLAWLQSLG